MPQTSAAVTAGNDAKASEFNKVVADLTEIYAGGPGVPVGAIIWWWSNNTVPLNYKVCDGTIVADAASALNGLTVPDLTSKFVRGVANANIRTSPVSGGEDTHVLTTSEIPSHSHGITQSPHSHGVSDPGHNHTLTGPRTTAAGTDKSGNGVPPHNSITFANNFIIDVGSRTTGISIASANASISINNAGGGAAHNNIPAYVGLVPIIRIK